MEKYPVQLVTLASERRGRLSGIVPENSLVLFADIVLQELSPITRRKCEHLVTELVHMHGVTRTLIQQNAVMYLTLTHAPTTNLEDRRLGTGE